MKKTQQRVTNDEKNNMIQGVLTPLVPKSVEVTVSRRGYVQITCDEDDTESMEAVESLLKHFDIPHDNQLENFMIMPFEIDDDHAVFQHYEEMRTASVAVEPPDQAEQAARSPSVSPIGKPDEIKNMPTAELQSICDRMKEIRDFIIVSFDPRDPIMQAWFDQYAKKAELLSFNKQLRTLLEAGRYVKVHGLSDFSYLENFVEAIDILDTQTERLRAILSQNLQLSTLLSEHIGVLELAKKSFYQFKDKRKATSLIPPVFLSSYKTEKRYAKEEEQRREMLEEESAQIHELQTLFSKFPSPYDKLRMFIENGYYVFSLPTNVKNHERYFTILENLMMATFVSTDDIEDTEFIKKNDELRVKVRTLLKVIGEGKTEEEFLEHMQSMITVCEIMLNRAPRP